MSFQNELSGLIHSLNQLERKVNLLYNERLLTPKNNEVIISCKAELIPAEGNFPKYQRAITVLSERYAQDRLFIHSQHEDSWLATELFAVFVGLIEIVGYQPMNFIADGLLDGLQAQPAPQYKGKEFLFVVKQKQLYFDLTGALEPESRTHLLKPCRDVFKALGVNVLCIEKDEDMYQELEVWPCGV